MTTPGVALLRRPIRVGVSHAVPSNAIVPGETSADDDGLSVFLSARPRLFGIAYRMLGSAADAEDIVQDVWVRWQTTDRSAVRNAPAFLSTTTTRLAINVIQSARSRRETYVGPWRSEPVDGRADPRLGAERGEALECAVLVLLEKLSPTERDAYVLREAFDYPYRKIADILRLEEANARQLVTRARQRIADGRLRARKAGRATVPCQCVDQGRPGSRRPRPGLVAPDVVSTPDGGGFVQAAQIAVVSREGVAGFIGPSLDKSPAA